MGSPLTNSAIVSAGALSPTFSDVSTDGADGWAPGLAGVWLGWAMPVVPAHRIAAVRVSNRLDMDDLRVGVGRAANGSHATRRASRWLGRPAPGHSVYPPVDAPGE